jgi:hypothetical protein
MSDGDSKVKHSKRLHKENVAIVKQTKIAKAHGIEVKEPHKFAKHHAMDCGQPNCIMCASPRKIWKEETIQERRAKQKEPYYEQDDGPLSEDQMNQIKETVK